MKEADKLMEKAETIRAQLSGWVVQAPSLPEDLVYDDLVCGYFRQGDTGAVSSLMHREGVERGRVSLQLFGKETGLIVEILSPSDIFPQA